MGVSALIHTNVVSGGVIGMSSIDFSTMKSHKMIIDNLVVATDDDKLYMRFYVGGSEVNSSGAYHWRNNLKASNGAGHTIDFSQTSTLGLLLLDDDTSWGIGVDSSEAYNAEIELLNFGSNSYYKGQILYGSYDAPGADTVRDDVWGQLRVLGAITGFKIISTSSIQSGRVTITGVTS